jgi:hypothetical protein
LEDEQHGARKRGSHAGEDFGNSHQHGHVNVVATRVHHADLLSAELRGDSRLERHVRFLGNRKCIHVRAQRDGRARTPTLQHGRYTGMRDAGPDFEAQLFEVLRHELGGPEFAVAELGVRMEVASPCENFRLDGARCRVDARLIGCGLRLADGEDENGADEEHGNGKFHCASMLASVYSPQHELDTASS